MLLAGVIAGIAASPFIFGVLGGGSGLGGGLGIVLDVRKFGPVAIYIDSLGTLSRNIIYLLILPINYLLELGFFFVVGLLWLQQRRNAGTSNNPFHVAEMILLLVATLIGSFVHSTIISNNDLGWRCWLFGQFVLLVWAVDILEQLFTGHDFKLKITLFARTKIIKAGRLLAILAAIGIFTTVLDTALLRTWALFIDNAVAGFPNGMSPDTQLSSRAFSARLAYDYIRDDLPENIIIQHNPKRGLDRPAGLYGSRQMVISAHTAYGIPQDKYQYLVKQVGQIFSISDVIAWDNIDNICDQYFINVIVVNDIDPLWKSIPKLVQIRPALYRNDYYAIFSCGRYMKHR